MPSDLSNLRSPAAVQTALDEFVKLGRTAFLARYGFGKSRDFLVRDPTTDTLCDSKAIVGAAYGYQYPDAGPLTPADFSGGMATVVPKLRDLGFEVVQIGQDWTDEEVDATVNAYFEMLRLEAEGRRYRKSDFNAGLRRSLRGRTKASVELKHQNISAILELMGLPTIAGYKSRGNAQLLLRKSVQRFVIDNSPLVGNIIDALEEAKPPSEIRYQAVLVDPPERIEVEAVGGRLTRQRMPRKVDHAARDDSNRKLGRLGEEWALNYEHGRLLSEGRAELVERLEWISDRLGDGAGYDILSYDAPATPRYIEVKTTNGSYATPFIISRNELEFSREADDQFYLYRVFGYRDQPRLFMLKGDISEHVHLDALDYRASFKRLIDQ